MCSLQSLAEQIVHDVDMEDDSSEYFEGNTSYCFEMFRSQLLLLILYELLNSYVH